MDIIACCIVIFCNGTKDSEGREVFENDKCSSRPVTLRTGENIKQLMKSCVNSDVLMFGLCQILRTLTENNKKNCDCGFACEKVCAKLVRKDLTCEENKEQEKHLL